MSYKTLRYLIEKTDKADSFHKWALQEIDRLRSASMNAGVFVPVKEYNKLEHKLAVAEEEFETAAMKCNDYQMEAYKLREKLTVAVEALEELEGYFQSNIIKQALSNIRGEK